MNLADMQKAADLFAVRKRVVEMLADTRSDGGYGFVRRLPDTVHRDTNLLRLDPDHFPKKETQDLVNRAARMGLLELKASLDRELAKLGVDTTKET